MAYPVRDTTPAASATTCATWHAVLKGSLVLVSLGECRQTSYTA
ncbi:hypothetical protein OG496_54150 [Streptomyces sp. NBC_00988]|nr:hypothetical protein OG496_54150 [Streptomyces sp. NBC_00988]